MNSSTIPYSEYLSPEMESRVRDLQKEDIQELWMVLGQSVDGEAATGEEPDGKRVFNRALRKIKESICNDPKIIKYIDDPATGDALSIAMVCTAKLASEQFAGIDICAIGLLIARIGIRVICATDKIE